MLELCLLVYCAYLIEQAQDDLCVHMNEATGHWKSSVFLVFADSNSYFGSSTSQGAFEDNGLAGQALAGVPKTKAKDCGPSGATL